MKTSKEKITELMRGHPESYFQEKLEQFLKSKNIFIENKKIQKNSDYNVYYYTLKHREKSYFVKIDLSKDGLFYIKFFNYVTKGKIKQTRDIGILLSYLYEKLNDK